MKPVVRYGLLAGAVAIAGGGILIAVVNHSHTVEPAYQAASLTDDSSSKSYGSRSRTGGKFFAQYDVDHDGKVTREEFNAVVARQFTQAAGGADSMTEAQYIAYRQNGLRLKTDQMFHRDDWNGDGKLTLEEYAQPERVRFETADRNGTGIIQCSGRGNNSAADDSYGTSSRNSGRAIFCKYDDLNHDEQVTRAEFDQATAQDFTAHARKGILTADDFYAIIAARVQQSAVRTFAMLDTNNDGKLDVNEFIASELRYFTRLDRNNDGVVTRDETGQRRTSALASDKPGRT